MSLGENSLVAAYQGKGQLKSRPSGTRLVTLSLACFHLLSSCVLKHSLVASSVSLSMSNLLFSASLGIFLSFILIPAITSLWSDAMSGPTNVRHLVTALFHLLFTIMKSIMFFVLPSGDSQVHFLFAFLCWNTVFITCRLLFRQKFSSLSP